MEATPPKSTVDKSLVLAMDTCVGVGNGTLAENEPEAFFLAVFVQALKLCSKNIPFVVQHETCVQNAFSIGDLSVCLHVSR